MKTFRSYRPLPIVFVALVLAVSPGCTGQTLSTPAGERARPWAGPPQAPLPELAVIHRSPEGPVTAATSVVAVFNQPMVALTDRLDAAPLRIEPELNGTVHWISGDTVKLEPGSPPRRGTRYTVRIPAGTRSLGGKVLAREVTWQFRTELPALERMELAPRADRYHPNRLEPTDAFILRFDQPVSPGEIGRHVKVAVNGAEVPVSAERAPRESSYDPGWQARVRLRTLRPLPLAARVTVSLAPGFRGLEGPLPAPQGATATFGDRPAPGVHVACNGAELHGGSGPAPTCWPMRNSAHPGLALRFTTPVIVAGVLSRLAIHPATAEGGQVIRPTDWESTSECRTKDRALSCTSELRLRRGLRPRTRYTVTLRPGARDVYGQTLAARWSTAFTTRGLPPNLFVNDDPPITREEDEWVLERSRPLRVQAVNVQTIELRSAVLGPDTFVPFLECLIEARKANYPVRGRRPPRVTCLDRPVPGVRVDQRTLAAAGPADRLVERPLDLLPPGRGGVVAFALSSPEVLGPRQERVSLARVVNHTGLDVHARLLAGSLHVWVTSLATGQPVPGAAVEVRHHDGRKLHVGQTDAAGLVALPGYGALAPAGGRIPRLYLWVSTATDAAYAVPRDPVSPYADSSEAVFSGRIAPWRDPSWEGEGPHRFGILGTERHLYQPGETVHVYGVVRQWRRGHQSPAAQERATLEVELREGYHRKSWPVIHRQEVTLDDFGAFTARYEIPATAELGTYAVTLRQGERRFLLAGINFLVLQYRAPRFSTTVKHPPSTLLMAGETFEATVFGQYLSGSPMSGASYQHSVWSSSEYSWTRSGHEFSSCQRGSPGSSGAGLASSDGRGTLSGAGEALIRIPTVARQLECAAKYALVTRVIDATQSAVEKHVTFRVLPGERLVGLRALPAGARWKRERIHALVTDRPGKPVTGQRVTLRVFVPRPGYDPREDPDDGKNEFEWARPALTRQQVTAASGVELSFDFPMAHPYVLATVSATDAQGRTSRSDLRIERPKDPRSAAQAEPTGPAPLRLQLDQKEYDPGATAVITVTAAVPLASATLFVERERGFLAQPLRFLAGKAVVRFRVDETHIRKGRYRGVQVSVVAYPSGPARGRADRPVLPLTVSEPLAVRATSLELDVALRPGQARYRPGQEVAVDYAVRSRDGRPREVELVVMAVDEAVLRLADRELKSPHQRLYFEPWRALLLDELREYLMPSGIRVEHLSRADGHLPDPTWRGRGGFGGWGGFGKGGGGGTDLAGWKPARRRFVTTPLFRLVRSSASGTGRVTFQLPDNLTAYRLMAVAFDRERRAGVGQARLEVGLPMYAVPAVPRVARVGDRFEGGVVVTNAGLPEGPVEVEVRATGLEITGPRVQRVTVPRSGARAVRFALAARAPGMARLDFRIRMGSETDRLEHALEVRRSAVPQHRAVAGSTEGTVYQALDSLAGVQPGFGGLDVTLSSTLIGGLGAGVDQLVSYPYDCQEQRASRLLPLLAKVSLGQRFQLEVPGDARALAARRLAEIVGSQTADGGFKWWPEDYQPSAWLTAYVLRVLHRAREAGIPVPAGAADRAARFIVEELARQDEAMVRDPLLEAARPLVALALAEQGYDVEPLIRQAFDQRTLLPVFAQAELLHALAVLRKARARGTPLRPLPRVKAPTSNRARTPLPRVAPSLPLDDLARALLRLVTGQVKVEGNHAFAVEPEWSGGQELLSSSDRTTAILLSALLATDPDHPLVDRLARYLVLGRKDAAGRPTARFGNTQEAAFGLLALWDHTRLREARVPDLTATVWLARSRLLTRRMSGHSPAPGRLHVPMADLLRSLDPARSRLTFQAQGAGRLYYSARLTSARQDPREPAASRGFEVRREVLVLDDRYRPLWERLTPRLGDVVQVLLTVRITEPRRRVVVDDPLPGGLEAIDSHVPSEYRPVSRLLTLEGKAVRTEFQHRELRHDRVLHFIDSLPPGTHHFGYHARVTSPGSFVWPAARVEEMYAPEVYGTSIGGVMTTARSDR